MEKKNVDRIGIDIIRNVRENIGVGPGDISKDDEINRMSPNEIFDRWCEWNGFIGLSGKFRKAVSSVYSVNI